MACRFCLNCRGRISADEVFCALCFRVKADRVKAIFQDRNQRSAAGRQDRNQRSAINAAAKAATAAKEAEIAAAWARVAQIFDQAG